MAQPVSMPIYGDPTAVVGRRVAAAAVDAAIVFGPAVAIEISRLEYLDVADTQFSDGEDYCDAYTELEGGFCADLDGTVYFADDNSAASSLLFFGLAVGMLVVLQGLTGFTVGKRLLGIRCVRPDGRPPGVGRAAARGALWIVDLLPCIGLVGFITSLTTVGHRRVGDMAANTYVVRAAAAGTPVAIPPATVARPGPPAPPGAGWPPPPPGYRSSTPPPPPAPVFAAPTARPGPQWDEARGTYIQWDPEQQAWVQWDDAAKVWVPIR